MSKAHPCQLVGPEEMDKRWHGYTATTIALAVNTVPPTSQTVRGSGSLLGFNLRLKYESTVYSLAWGSGACWVCFFKSTPNF